MDPEIPGLGTYAAPRWYGAAQTEPMYRPPSAEAATPPLKVVRGAQQELREACPGSFYPNYNAIGCAKHGYGVCTIYILNDQGLQAIGWDVEIVVRHERAHCNGWSHPR